MKHRRLFFIFLAILIIGGCAETEKKAERPLVFYPEPPDPPRIQYLTFYTGSKEIEPAKSNFDVFVTGEKGKVRRLDKPYGAAIYKGKIYVCDTNTTVMIFDLEKKTFSPMQAATAGMGKLTQPLNISIDKEGNKYVADPVRGQVVMYDKNDIYVRAFGIPGEWKPIDAESYEDRLYVTDIKNGVVVVFDKNTEAIIKKIGKEGDEKLGMPTNLAFDSSGYLYVSDAARFQVIKYDRDGHFISALGKLGNNLGHFARPRGVAIDRNGILYVVDAAFESVQMFKDNQMLLFFGKGGKGEGNFYLPAKVVIDYENARYFQQYTDPKFDLEYVILVTNQFGDNMVNVFGFGKEKGKQYPTDEELKELWKTRVKDFVKEDVKPDEGKEANKKTESESKGTPDKEKSAKETEKK